MREKILISYEKKTIDFVNTGLYYIIKGGVRILKDIDRLVQETDASTGEILRTFGIANDEELFVIDREKGAGAGEPAKKRVFTYNAEFIKVFSLRGKEVWALENGRLFVLLIIMGQWLDIDSGVLKYGAFPLTWAHLSEMTGISMAQMYRHREKMLRMKFVAEIKLFKKKYIALNPIMVGRGSSVPTHISHLFEKTNREKFNKKEQGNGGRKAR